MSNFGEAVLQMAMEKGKDESSIMCIKNLMSTMGFSVKQAMDALGISPIDQEKYSAMLIKDDIDIILK